MCSVVRKEKGLWTQSDLSPWNVGHPDRMDCTHWASGSVIPSLRDPQVHLSQSSVIRTALENRAFIGGSWGRTW